MSDICISPAPAQSIVNIAKQQFKGATADNLQYYLLCEDQRSPDDPSFKPPGAYGSIVQFYRESNTATDSVGAASTDIKSERALANQVQPELTAMDDSVAQVRKATADIVGLASCKTVGGRSFRPVFKALCEEVVRAGFAQFWATHIAMGTFLLLLMLAGTWFCHGNRHPAATLRHLTCQQGTRDGP
jgi:hypothetical protein